MLVLRNLVRAGRAPLAIAGLILTLTSGGLLSPLPALAQSVRIAAVVNDEVISIADLEARINLVVGTSSLPDTPETRRRVAPQVMRQMIDEKIELQEAKKHNIDISPEEIKGQLAYLEQQNKMPPGGLDKLLEDHHIDKSTLIGQITAQMTWSRLVRARYGHLVNVGDEEVSEKVAEFEANRGQPQNRVAEIFLSVPSPAQDSEVHDLADRLALEISKGAHFRDVAHQFSQSATAAVGGDIGWVLPGGLDPEVQNVIDQMQPGMMSRPIRLTGGYYIFLLIDRRAPDAGAGGVTLNLTQVVLSLAANADPTATDLVMDKAKSLTADAHSCGEMAKIGKDNSPDLSGPIGDVKLSDLPAELRPVLAAAPLATPTRPVRVPGGIGVFMVCHKEGGEAQVNRDQILESLTNDRLDHLAQRYLSDLHRIAYVDLRV